MNNDNDKRGIISYSNVDEYETGIISIDKKDGTFSVFNKINSVIVGTNLTCEQMGLLFENATDFMIEELKNESVFDGCFSILNNIHHVGIGTNLTREQIDRVLEKASLFMIEELSRER